MENWLLDVTGGGWEQFRASYFPCTVTGAVAGMANLDTEEIGTNPELTVSLTADGEDVGFRASVVIAGDRRHPPAGVPCRVPFAVPFTFVASGPALIAAVLTSSAAALATIRFAIQGLAAGS